MTKEISNSKKLLYEYLHFFKELDLLYLAYIIYTHVNTTLLIYYSTKVMFTNCNLF